MENKKIISQFHWIGKNYDQNGNRISKNDKKLTCFALGDQKVFLVSYEKYGTPVCTCQSHSKN